MCARQWRSALGCILRPFKLGTGNHQIGTLGRKYGQYPTPSRNRSFNTIPELAGVQVAQTACPFRGQKPTLQECPSFSDFGARSREVRFTSMNRRREFDRLRSKSAQEAKKDFGGTWVKCVR